jgi:hypothetical protein
MSTADRHLRIINNQAMDVIARFTRDRYQAARITAALRGRGLLAPKVVIVAAKK